MVVPIVGMGIDVQRRTGSEKTIALQYDAEGKLRHDAIARIGHAKDKVGPSANVNFLGISHRCFWTVSQGKVEREFFPFSEGVFNSEKVENDRFKIIYSRLSDMKSKVIDEEDESFQRPDEETIAERTESTRLALEKITASKLPAEDKAVIIRWQVLYQFVMQR
uniref:Uncharacterized protein n=1 Tax=Parascaris equorum TaxID=6256 RepID=A0A914RWW2_PAREQ